MRLALLQALPREFGFAIIFMQHLSSTHKSLMPEMMLTQRADLDLEEMADSQPLLPGHIYLYPSDQEIRIWQGTIHAHPGTGEHRHLDIPISFHHDALRVVGQIIVVSNCL